MPGFPRRIALLLALTLATSPALADPSPCGNWLRVTGTTAYGSALLDVALAGSNVAVSAEDDGLLLIDPGDPARPVIIGTEASVRAIRVAVAGSLAFVTSGFPRQLSIVDISDPQHPSVIGSHATISSAYDVVVVGDEAYVSVAEQGPAGGAPPFGLERFDVSDPENPVSLGLVNDYWTTSVATDGTYLYAGRDGGGLEIFDVSGSAPVLMGAVGGFGAYSLAVRGDVVYAADLAPTSVVTVDVSDRSQPVVRHTNPLAPVYGLRVSLYTNYLVATMDSALEFYDLADPLAPAHAFTVQVPRSSLDAVFDGPLGFVASVNEGLHVLDLGTLDLPAVTGVLAGLTPAGIDGIEIEGGTAWTSESGFGVRALDVSDPTSPATLGQLVIGDPVRGLALDQGRGYATTGSTGLTIFDATDPTGPTVLGTLDTPVNATAIDVANAIAVVADGFAGLQIVDATDPALPEIAATQPLSGSPAALVLRGELAYVCTSAGLEIVDVSMPASPATRGSFAGPPGGFGSVALQGDTAFVTARGSLFVLDVTDADAPAHLTDLPWVAGALSREPLAPGYLLALSDWGLTLLDVRDPLSPRILSSGIGGPDASAAVVKDDHVLIAAGAAGLQDVLLACQDPVPVTVSHFDARLDGAVVRIRWGASTTDAASFRLEAAQGGTTRELDIERVADEEFVASDPAPEGPDRIDYTLYHRSGSAWTVVAVNSIRIPSPVRTRLTSAAPNPFNPKTVVSFTLARSAEVRISVHDLRGARVRRLCDEAYDAGPHTVEWDGRDDGGNVVAAGAYLVRMRTADAVDHLKVMLVK